MDRLTAVLKLRAARVTLVVVSLVAALSVGGAFFAGVVLVPLLVLVARPASRVGAWGYGLLAGVLATEIAWGLTYVSVGEQQPLIWLLPAAVGAAAVGAAVVKNAEPNAAQT